MRSAVPVRSVENMDENETNENPDPEKRRSSNWLTYGLIFGMLGGTVIGVIVDNLAVWMAVGIAIGAAIGAGFSQTRQ